jgi:hypothetical protein
MWFMTKMAVGLNLQFISEGAITAQFSSLILLVILSIFENIFSP